MTDDRVDAQRNEPVWGSDVIAETLRETGVPYLVLNPGGSYRGLHDSVVNYLENHDPQIVMCLHEENAVAVAHGYAMVTGEPLAVALHSNVGLMHATMAIFNAWCGRFPIIIFGATGPTDADLRRPWIDWIHTTADHGALVRNYTKWDDQPASVAAAVESIRRAAIIAKTEPTAPVFINLDASVQEGALDDWPVSHPPERFTVPRPPAADASDLQRAAEILKTAERPVILVGRVSRSDEAWAERVALAEAIGARVFTSVGAGAGFPTSHPLHAGEAGFAFWGEELEIIKQADAILSLDWRDLGGTLKTVWSPGEALPPVISCSMDHQISNGWSMDYYSLVPADIRIATVPESLVPALLPRFDEESVPEVSPTPATPAPPTTARERLGATDISEVFNISAEKHQLCLINRPIRWPLNHNRYDHPLAYLGDNGGGGLGAGPGLSVGAALALRDRHPDWVPVTVVGDGDFLMAGNALWTAAKYRIPLLVVIANNHTYFADEALQEGVAQKRGRPVENKKIGISITDPDPDFVGIARANGFEAHGPISDRTELEAKFAEAVLAVAEGRCVLLDVDIEQEAIQIFPPRPADSKGR